MNTNHKIRPEAVLINRDGVWSEEKAWRVEYKNERGSWQHFVLLFPGVPGAKLIELAIEEHKPEGYV